jgi:hypothetical protein
MSADYVNGLFQAMGYAPSAITLETVPLSAGHNVYVTKVGSVYPNSYIEFGAHLDSVAGAPGVNGSGNLSWIDFDVVGNICESSGLLFNISLSVLYDNVAHEISATWVNDSVHVTAPTPTVSWYFPSNENSRLSICLSERVLNKTPGAWRIN